MPGWLGTLCLITVDSLLPLIDILATVEVVAKLGKEESMVCQIRGCEVSHLSIKLVIDRFAMIFRRRAVVLPAEGCLGICNKPLQDTRGIRRGGMRSWCHEDENLAGL